MAKTSLISKEKFGQTALLNFLFNHSVFIYLSLNFSHVWFVKTSLLLKGFHGSVVTHQRVSITFTQTKGRVQGSHGGRGALSLTLSALSKAGKPVIQRPTFVRYPDGLGFFPDLHHVGLYLDLAN